MRQSLTLRTTNNRCPFLPELLALPITQEQALSILLVKGYKIIEFDFLKVARACIGKSKYKLCKQPEEAPGYVDCASFVRYIYAQFGIWLPRYSNQQRELGNEITPEDCLAGDLIFCQGHYGKFWTDPNDQVGHVGMITGEQTVIHAAGSRQGVVETTTESFTRPSGKFRGIKRVCNLNSTVVLEIRAGRLIETLDDLRWDILNVFGR